MRVAEGGGDCEGVVTGGGAGSRGVSGHRGYRRREVGDPRVAGRKRSWWGAGQELRGGREAGGVGERRSWAGGREGGGRWAGRGGGASETCRGCSGGGGGSSGSGDGGGGSAPTRSTLRAPPSSQERAFAEQPGTGPDDASHPGPLEAPRSPRAGTGTQSLGKEARRGSLTPQRTQGHRFPRAPPHPEAQGSTRVQLGAAGSRHSGRGASLCGGFRVMLSPQVDSFGLS